MDNLAEEYNRLAAKIRRLSGENAALRANIMAWPQFPPEGSKHRNYGFMSVEKDKPGFKYPPIARDYGFMTLMPIEEYAGTTEPEGFQHTFRDRKFGFMADTMQAAQPCECKSLSSGVATGVGIAVGVGVVAGAAWGILKLMKR